MNKKNIVSQKVDKDVVTPTPPQVMDPSSPPGEGRNASYGKGNKKEKTDKRE